jgi:hypothetical protein
MIEVEDYRRDKAVDMTVKIPVWLKEAGEAVQVNFSGLLQEALKQKLGY